MGAWGEKTFDDDTALDLLDDWMEAKNPVDSMRAAIVEALEEDYLEYTEGHVISVAAAILDYQLNGQPFEEADIEDLGPWLETLNQERLAELRPLVLDGLTRLLGDESELAELWAENEDLYPKWRAILEGRQSRLQAATG